MAVFYKSLQEVPLKHEIQRKLFVNLTRRKLFVNGPLAIILHISSHMREKHVKITHITIFSATTLAAN